MGCKWYVAMTAAQMLGRNAPRSAAWMACHFSPYSTGLSNLPGYLPPDSLVILDDSTPLARHDPERIAAQLAGIENMAGLLLDLQRESTEAAALAAHLAQALPCPIAVTEQYGKAVSCGIFLSPPLNKPLADAVKPWQSRDIWLDIPFGMQAFTVTAQGCEISQITPVDNGDFPHRDEVLHCSYRIRTAPDHIRFTLRREPPALQAILDEAQALGISRAISLHQEFYP